MGLTSLHAENVLSFETFDLDFQPGLNVIVGPNGVGKSNLIRLISLIRTALDCPSADLSEAKRDLLSAIVSE